MQKEPLWPLKTKQPPLSKQLQGGEAHGYSLDLKAGQFIYLLVDQDGIDVVVSLYSPDGNPLRIVDGPYRTKGQEWLSWIAEVKGKYRLEVRALEKTAKAGRYTIKDVAIREATPPDRKYLTADLVSQLPSQFKDAGQGSAKALELRSAQALSETLRAAARTNHDRRRRAGEKW